MAFFVYFTGPASSVQTSYFCFGQEVFGSRIRVIARPSDCDTATVRGAAQYGLARRPLVSSVIAPQSYMLKVRVQSPSSLWLARSPTRVRAIVVQVKLPAEQEDWLKRPAYIRENDAGISICENRYGLDHSPEIRRRP